MSGSYECGLCRSEGHYSAELDLRKGQPRFEDQTPGLNNIRSYSEDQVGDR